VLFRSGGLPTLSRLIGGFASVLNRLFIAIGVLVILTLVAYGVWTIQILWRA